MVLPGNSNHCIGSTLALCGLQMMPCMDFEAGIVLVAHQGGLVFNEG